MFTSEIVFWGLGIKDIGWGTGNWGFLNSGNGELGDFKVGEWGLKGRWGMGNRGFLNSGNRDLGF